jgi:hypothetical protein
MEKNVGGNDRLARFVVGPILIAVGFAALGGLFTIAAGPLGTALAVVAVLVGLVLTVTASTQTCPLNSMLGIDTYDGGETDRPATEDGDAGPKED